MRYRTPPPQETLQDVNGHHSLYPPSVTRITSKVASLGIRELNNDDSNENGRKAIGLRLAKQQLASRVFGHFFAVDTRPRREND